MPRRKKPVFLLIFVLAVIAVLLFRYAPPSWKNHFVTGPAVSCGGPCGVERWPVKTLTDSDAARVNFAPQPASIAWLVSQPPPSYLPAASRIAPLELQTFIVRARVLGFKLEDDQDIHIVLADPGNSSLTMIAEIPSAACSGACASAHVQEFDAARSEWMASFGEPQPYFRRVPGNPLVVITGVAFFDFLHQQRGVAPNGIELHPVLSVQPE